MLSYRNHLVVLEEESTVIISSVVNGLKCSEPCRLSSCKNQPTEDVPLGGQLDANNNTDIDDDDYDD